MYGQTSYSSSSYSSPSKNSNTAPGLTALLLGVIVLYQIVSHIFLHNAVSHEEDELESDAACAAVPGSTVYSSLCMEAHLFKGWNELPKESATELNDLLAASPSKAEEPAATTTAAPSAPADEGQQALRGDAKPEGAKDTPPGDTKALEGMLWDMAWKMGGGDQTHSAPEKTKKPNAFMAKKAEKPKKKKTSWAKGLPELQQELEGKMQSQARKHAEHRALRALSVAARGHSSEANSHAHETAWAHNLDDLTHELQGQMDTWRKHREEHAASFAAAHTHLKPKEDLMTPWAHNLDDLTHDLQDKFDKREKVRAEHEAAHEAAHAARLKAAQPQTRTVFMEQVDALGRELCQDPIRRDNAACAQFLHPHAEASPTGHTEEKKHENAMTHIKLLEKHLEELEKDREHDNEEIRQESNQFLKELCDDPARHSYPACARLLAARKPATSNLRSSSAAAKTATAPVATEETNGVAAAYPAVLQWTAMTPEEVASKKSTDHLHPAQHMGASPLLMHRQELRGLHWEGSIPKVACVTVLPQGQVTETLMRYFMDNYNLIHYEGARELVLVYHNEDKESARIAHLYADGTTVKAAAARGDGGFPSAMAYRYGAWMAHDADLVVRYDFEAWHHPNRLSMQVRAIAQSKRPASLVARVTAFDAEGKSGTVAGGAGPHGSLMGDAQWMRKHWMPMMEEEGSLLVGLHSADVVQVAMPELMAYHDVSMLNAPHSWVDVDA